jgi:hypothetical protein
VKSVKTPTLSSEEIELQSYLDRLETDIEITPHWRIPSPLQNTFMKVLEKMEVKKSSIVVEPEETYHCDKAIARMGYTTCRRTIDDRGTKKWRYWVLSHVPKVKKSHSENGSSNGNGSSNH